MYFVTFTALLVLIRCRLDWLYWDIECVCMTDEQAATVEQAIDTQRKAKQKVTDLEAKLHDAKGVREKELRNAENCVAKAKTKMEEASKKMKELHQVSVGEGHSSVTIPFISWIFAVFALTMKCVITCGCGLAYGINWIPQ